MNYRSRLGDVAVYVCV